MAKKTSAKKTAKKTVKTAKKKAKTAKKATAKAKKTTTKAAPKAAAEETAPAPKKKAKGYSKKDVKEFQVLLEDLYQEITGDVKAMESEVLSRSRDDASTQDISDFADLGTENFETEFTFGLIESEQKELEEINLAFDRIKEGTYGVCTGCGGLIPKTRLRAVPYAGLCITCKKQMEEEEGV